MLQILVGLLLVLNGLLAMDSGGWIGSSVTQWLVVGPEPATLPQIQTGDRLALQSRPGDIKILKNQVVDDVDVFMQRGSEVRCLQAGLLTEKQTNVLKLVLEAEMPNQPWELVEYRQQPRWIIYMGPYASLEQLQRKKGELKSRNVSYEPLKNADMEPGLSLGAFETSALAQQALSKMSRQGIRTARVAQESPEVHGFWLRLPAADDAFTARVEEYKPLWAGKPWQSCTAKATSTEGEALKVGAAS